jgi:hypothetical protein
MAVLTGRHALASKFEETLCHRCGRLLGDDNNGPSPRYIKRQMRRCVQWLVINDRYHYRCIPPAVLKRLNLSGEQLRREPQRAARYAVGPVSRSDERSSLVDLHIAHLTSSADARTENGLAWKFFKWLRSR